MGVTSIQFNNIRSYEDLGLVITDMVNLPIANETIEIDNGYTIKTGEYSPLEIPVTFMRRDLKSIFDIQHTISNWLTNVKDNRLIFGFLKDKYYIVKKVQFREMHRLIGRYSKFSVTFTVEPFKYDVNDSIIKLTKPRKIRYDGTAIGEPNIKIYGNGNIQLTINDETLEIKNVKDFVEIDSKLLLCLNQDKTSKTRDMIGDFPLLDIGINEISWTGNVTRVELFKRTAFL